MPRFFLYFFEEHMQFKYLVLTLMLSFLLGGCKKASDELASQSKSISMLKDKVVEIDLSRVDSNMLTPILGDAVKKSKVIALGESTHGSHEFLVLRNDIIKYLVNADSIRCLIIEDDWGLTKDINNYISGSSGITKEAELRQSYCKEDFELFEWLKEINKPTPIVKIFGLAVADVSDRASEHVRSFIEKNDKSFYKDFFSFSSIDNQKVLEHFLKKRKYFLKNLSTYDINYAIGCAIISANIQKLRSFETFSPEFNQFRDSVSGIVVNYLINNSSTGDKFIIVGHSGHISKQNELLGNYLSNNLKNRYYNLSFLFNTGCYTTWTSGVRGEKCTSPAIVGSLENEFSKVGIKSFFIRSNDILLNVPNTYLTERFIGLSGADVYGLVSLATDFDSYFFLDSVTPLLFFTN